LNLNIEEKYGSVGNEVVASKVVGVGVGVVCCRRGGLKKGGGGGIVKVKADVISGITVTGRCIDMMSYCFVLHDELWCPSRKQSHC
ncbi:hypothetical protein Tco_0871960, partial [Tanacetum coccineum]